MDDDGGHLFCVSLPVNHLNQFKLPAAALTNLVGVISKQCGPPATVTDNFKPLPRWPACVLHKSYAHCHSAICADSGVAMCIRFMQQDRKVPGSNPTQRHLDRLQRKGREIQSPATGHPRVLSHL